MATPFAPEKPTFGPDNDSKNGVYDDQKTPLGNPTDPRNDVAAGNTSDPRSFTGDELEGKEAGIKPGASMNVGREEKKALPGISGNEKKATTSDRIRSQLRLTRRKGVAMIVAGTIGFGGFEAFSIIQGPLQLMHLSQALQKPFAQQEEDSETRMRGLFRYARSGDFGETRVSYFGSRSAKKTEERMQKKGITIGEKSSTGKPAFFDIDVKTMGKENAQRFIKQLTEKGLPQGSIETIRSKNVVTSIRIHVGTNPDYIRMTELAAVDHTYADRWKPIRKATVAVKGRVVTARDGAYPKWRVWKRAQVKILDKAAAIDQRRKDAKSQRKAQAEARIEKLKSKISPRTAGGAAAATGVQLGICLIKDISHEVPLLNHENVNVPARADAVKGIAGGEQIKAMDDFHISQPGQTISEFTDTKGNTIWQSQALNALVNSDSGAGKDIDQDTKNSFSHKSSEAEVENAIDHFGGDYICSPAGQAVGLGIGFVAIIAAAPTGGASLAAYGALQIGSGAAFAVGLAAVTQMAIKNLKDEPLPARIDDAPFQGSIFAFGAEDMAGDFYRKAGAAALPVNATTAPTVGQLKEQGEFNQRNFFARTFDIYDYRSVASRTVDKINPSPGNSLQHVASLLFSPQLWLSGLFSSLNHRVSAANTHDAYDFGFPKYGFRQSELTNPIFEDPYDNAEKAASILQARPEWKDRALKCFGVELTQGIHGWEVNVADNPDGDAEKAVIPSTGDYINANCAEGNDDWLRVRLFIFDSRTMEAYACYDDDDEACQAIGIDSGNTTASSSNSVTDSDAKELAKQILESPNVSFPYVDSAGDTAKKVLESIRDTGKAFTNSLDPLAIQNREVSVNVKMLQALEEYLKNHRLSINAITNGDHSSTSNHYSGEAVDFDCSPALDKAAWEQIASKYGGKNNGEVCPADKHWHYDFLKK